MRAGYHEVAKSIVMWGIYATGKLFNVRQDDLTGLDLTNQGTGTRSFSSSKQFRTMLILGRSVSSKSARYSGVGTTIQ